MLNLEAWAYNFLLLVIFDLFKFDNFYSKLVLDFGTTLVVLAKCSEMQCLIVVVVYAKPIPAWFIDGIYKMLYYDTDFS